jgi:hypothetical protein
LSARQNGGPLHASDIMMTERRASRRCRLATESNVGDGVGSLKVTIGWPA